jgi:hypothetical protein
VTPAAAIPAARRFSMLTSAALPEPVLAFRSGAGRWRVAEDFRVEVLGERLLVPAGFETDLASVPRGLWWLVAPFELGTVAPVVHDYLYRHGGRPVVGWLPPRPWYSRAAVDLLFLEIMEATGVPEWRRRTAYAGVRAFGWRHWRGL